MIMRDDTRSKLRRIGEVWGYPNGELLLILSVISKTGYRIVSLTGSNDVNPGATTLVSEYYLHQYCTRYLV